MAETPWAAGIQAFTDLAKTGADLYSKARALKAEKEAREQHEANVREGVEEAGRTYDDLMSMLENYKSGQYKFSDPRMAGQYSRMISDFDPESMIYTPEQFSFDKTKEDYVTPYMDDILSQVEARVQGTAAGAGLGRGTGTAEAIASADAEKMNELYQQAQQQYTQDRDFAYKNYADYINNMQNRYSNLANLTSEKIKLMGGAIAHDETQESDYMKDLMGIMQDKAQTKLTGMLNA